MFKFFGRKTSKDVSIAKSAAGSLSRSKSLTRICVSLFASFSLLLAGVVSLNQVSVLAEGDSAETSNSSDEGSSGDEAQTVSKVIFHWGIQENGSEKTTVGTFIGKYGASVNQPPVVEREGYSLAGWAATQGGTKVREASGAITIEELVPDADGNVNLYAIWTEVVPDKTIKSVSGEATTRVYADSNKKVIAPDTLTKDSNWVAVDDKDGSLFKKGVAFIETKWMNQLTTAKSDKNIKQAELPKAEIFAAKKAAVLDFSAMKNENEEVSIDGEVTVYINVTDDLIKVGNGTLKIKYIGNDAKISCDKKLELAKVETLNNLQVYKVSLPHLSPYLLYVEDAASASSEGLIKTKTGDFAGILIVTSIIVLSVVGVLYIRKRSNSK